MSKCGTSKSLELTLKDFGGEKEYWKYAIMQVQQWNLYLHHHGMKQMCLETPLGMCAC